LSTDYVQNKLIGGRVRVCDPLGNATQGLLESFETSSLFRGSVRDLRQANYGYGLRLMRFVEISNAQVCDVSRQLVPFVTMK
jgi:hypothetical protein